MPSLDPRGVLFNIPFLTFMLYLSFVRKLEHHEIQKKRLKTEDIGVAQRIPVTVIVDNVRSLYNVGSIFRTSDGAMIQELILTGYTPTPPRKEIEKTALGSTKSVPWRYVKDPLEALAMLEQRGMKSFCLEITDSSVPYYDVPYREFPICLVIGNEITGVSRKVVERCTHALEIPMHGLKHSLNVAVAYGVAVLELSRIWRGGRIL